MSRLTPHSVNSSGVHSSTELGELPTVVSRAPAPGDFDEAAPLTIPGDDTRPALLLTRGPGAGRRLPVSSETVLVLGRRADCDLVLPDVTVSRRHAQIRSEGERLVLTDTGSLNGTYVNQHPVDTVVLNDGDTIAIGIFRLRFLAATPASMATARAADPALV